MKIVIIGAGKGGTGKTTATANIGKALSLKYRVALLDLDTCGPNLPRIVGVTGNEVECDNDFFYPKKFSATLEVFSPAYLFPADVAVAWSGNKRKELIHELIEKVKWDSPDVLLCDAPPGTSDEILAVLQYMPKVDGAVIVTLGRAEALDDARRLITLLNNRLYGVPVLGVVENMACIETSGGTTPLFSDGVDVGLELGEEVIAKIPWKYPVTVDMGFDRAAEIIARKLELDGADTKKGG